MDLTISSVGHGADVGLHPVSRWNNPEPEIVLLADSSGIVRGVTLGANNGHRRMVSQCPLCSTIPSIWKFDAIGGFSRLPCWLPRRLAKPHARVRWSDAND